VIKGGIGGELTKTGLKFEKKTDLESALISAGLSVEVGSVYQKGVEIGFILSKHRLYTDFLEPQKIEWKKHISKRLIPDEAYYSKNSNELIIIEKKYQQVSGSVDEKLQTIGFKIRQYKKLLRPLGVEPRIIFVLNDWFKSKSYKDSLDYIKECGGDYFFNEIPLAELGIQVNA
jgi:hypothetical protein